MNMSLKNINRLKRAVWSILYITEILILTRLVLSIIYAGQVNGFFFFIKEITNFIIKPFENTFPDFTLASYLIDFNLIFAMIVYYVIGWTMARLLKRMEVFSDGSEY